MALSPVRMHVEWAVPSGQAVHVAEALHTIMGVTRRQHGCVACVLAAEAGDMVRLRYDEEWQDEDHLKRQLASERFTRLTGLLELGTDPPLVQFSLAGGVRGLDYVDEVRRARAGTHRQPAG
jgi:quinol monooxygenase YgiN